MQKEILESLDDVGRGPFGCECFVLRREKEENKEEEDALSKVRESSSCGVDSNSNICNTIYPTWQLQE